MNSCLGTYIDKNKLVLGLICLSLLFIPYGSILLGFAAFLDRNSNKLMQDLCLLECDREISREVYDRSVDDDFPPGVFTSKLFKVYSSGPALVQFSRIQLHASR
jgi:hypothetical protein